MYRGTIEPSTLHCFEQHEFMIADTPRTRNVLHGIATRLFSGNFKRSKVGIIVLLEAAIVANAAGE